MKKCPQCGTESYQSKFCPKCGSSLASVVEQQDPADSGPYGRNEAENAPFSQPGAAPGHKAVSKSTPPRELRRNAVIAAAIAVVTIVAVVAGGFATHMICFHEWADADCITPRTCVICGKTDGSAVGHDWEDATCTERRTCKVCDAKQGAALGHTVPDTTVDVEPTCQMRGKGHGVCKTCGETVEVDIPTVPHVEGDWEVVKESTVSSSGDVTPGERALKCSVCGANIKTERYSITVTTSQKNALKKAQQYLNYMPFSYSGLVDQLEFEGFSNDDSTFAADHCGADWYRQAEKKAKQYVDYSAFSRSGLIGQLEFEGFTADQASHGADYVGL